MAESNVYNCVLRHPARILIFGPSFSGKSTLVSKIIDNQFDIFDDRFSRIIYCSDGSDLKLRDTSIYLEKYDIYDENLFETLDKQVKNCIIIDDFMHRAANDIKISELFTKRSHHNNTSIIFLLQNIYPKSKYMTDIKRNASYIIFMRNPSDEKSIKLFSSQYDPHSPKYLYESYLDATNEKPFSHLLVDLHQDQANEIRLRSPLIDNGDDSGNHEITAYIKIQEYPRLCRRIGLVGQNEKTERSDQIDRKF